MADMRALRQKAAVVFSYERITVTGVLMLVGGMVVAMFVLGGLMQPPPDLRGKVVEIFKDIILVLLNPIAKLMADLGKIHALDRNGGNHQIEETPLSPTENNKPQPPI